MIRIEKTSSSQIKQEDFLNIIHDLQQYFYKSENENLLVVSYVNSSNKKVIKKDFSFVD